MRIRLKADGLLRFLSSLVLACCFNSRILLGIHNWTTSDLRKRGFNSTKDTIRLPYDLMTKLYAQKCNQETIHTSMTLGEKKYQFLSISTILSTERFVLLTMSILNDFKHRTNYKNSKDFFFCKLIRTAKTVMKKAFI